MTDENRKSDEEIAWEEAVYQAQKADFQLRRKKSFLEWFGPSILKVSLIFILWALVTVLVIAVVVQVWLFRSPYKTTNP